MKALVTLFFTFSALASPPIGLYKSIEKTGISQTILTVENKGILTFTTITSNKHIDLKSIDKTAKFAIGITKYQLTTRDGIRHLTFLESNCENPKDLPTHRFSDYQIKYIVRPDSLVLTWILPTWGEVFVNASETDFVAITTINPSQLYQYPCKSI
jgi:hypothetical protein